MLTVANIKCSQSDMEAQESIQALNKTVEDMVKKNEALLRRLERFDTDRFGNAPIRFHDDNDSAIRRQDSSSAGPSSRRGVGILLTLDESISLRDSQESVISPREFEVTLGQTRVYARVQSNDCDISFTSSAIRTNALSSLSDLSSNDTSVISVLTLPISWKEVDSIESHLTLARILSDVKQPEPREALASQSSLNPSSDAIQPWSTRRERYFRLLTTGMRQQKPKRPTISSPFLQAALNPLPESSSNQYIPKRPSPVLERPPWTPRPGAMKLYKLVVLGDGGTGKTDLTVKVRSAFRLSMEFNILHCLHFKQLCLTGFVDTYDPTIEDSYRKQCAIDGESCMLEVLDTAGQEEFIALREQWIRDGQGFLLVYSISSRGSFTRIKRFHHQIARVKEALCSSPAYPGSPLLAQSGQEPAPVMLVGNNVHRVTEREVSTEEGRALAEELGCEFVEASAATDVNVEKAFYDVVRMIRRQRQLQPAPRPIRRETNPERYNRRWIG